MEDSIGTGVEDQTNRSLQGRLSEEKKSNNRDEEKEETKVEAGDSTSYINTRTSGRIHTSSTPSTTEEKYKVRSNSGEKKKKKETNSGKRPKQEEMNATKSETRNLQTIHKLGLVAYVRSYRARDWGVLHGHHWTRRRKHGDRRNRIGVELDTMQRLGNFSCLYSNRNSRTWVLAQLRPGIEQWRRCKSRPSKRSRRFPKEASTGSTPSSDYGETPD